MNSPETIPFRRTGFRVLGITALFAVVGPVLGILTLLSTALLVNGSPATISDVMSMLMSVTLVLPFAYLLGAVPAAVAGLLVAIGKERMGRAPWWMALAIGIVVGVAFIYFLERPPASYPAPQPRMDNAFRLSLLATNVVPTMLCWWIVRNWFLQRTEK